MNLRLLNTISKTQLVTMSNTLPKKVVVATVTMATMVMNTVMMMRCVTTQRPMRIMIQQKKNVRLQVTCGPVKIIMTMTMEVRCVTTQKLIRTMKQQKMNVKLQDMCG